jgi:hypothetical protein
VHLLFDVERVCIQPLHALLGCAFFCVAIATVVVGLCFFPLFPFFRRLLPQIIKPPSQLRRRPEAEAPAAVCIFRLRHSLRLMPVLGDFAWCQKSVYCSSQNARCCVPSPAAAFLAGAATERAKATVEAAHGAVCARPRVCTLNTANHDGWQRGERLDGRGAVQVAVQQRVAGADNADEARS